MKKTIAKLVDWFEHGDLVPLIVIVSAVHYSLILKEHDLIPVAISIGLMIDLGHYRIVRAAVRYSGSAYKQIVTRWGFVVFMTAVSIAYQQRFYNDWWLSLPLPFLIVSLAWLQHTDSKTGKRTKANNSEPLAKVKRTERMQSEPEQVKPAYVCGDCGYIAKTQNALNGHKRKHSAVISKNGAK